MSIEALKQDIEALQRQVADKQKEIDFFELDPDDFVDQYEEMLDECYDGVFGIEPSRILKMCDPVAYRVGLGEYVDGMDKEDIPEYRELLEEMEELEEALQDAEDTLEELLQEEGEE